MDRLTATRVFVEVIDSGSQTAAAERLDMSRAMVSRYLAELEEWVGARLLHRSTRRLSLTDAGAELLPQCREMLAVADAMQATGQTRRDSPRGTLRITSSLSFAQAWLTRAAAAFVERYPGTAIDLQVNSQVVNLVEERIDLALRIANQLDPNLIARRLGECRSVICAAPDYLRRHGTPRRPEDLALHNCLTYSYFTAVSGSSSATASRPACRWVAVSAPTNPPCCWRPPPPVPGSASSRCTRQPR